MCANLGKQRVVLCGFSWLLRVIDHEAVLVDPKLFSSWVHRSVVLLKRWSGRQTSSRWRFSRKNRLGSASNSAARDKGQGHMSALYSKMVIGRQKLGWHLLLRRWVFTAVCCGLRSSELQAPPRGPFYIKWHMPATRHTEYREPRAGELRERAPIDHRSLRELPGAP
jgi:hypothetical protein